MTTLNLSQQNQSSGWLKSYYATRAAFSVAWVVAAISIGHNSPALAAVLLTIYPLWDAVANIADARKHGSYTASPTQVFNTVVSIITTLAVVVALQISMFAVLGVFGVWATLSGILQLATAVRRWKTTGAQWAMILSGAQSALAGGHMLFKATSSADIPSVADIAPYAAFGAFYFMVSAIQLAVAGRRKQA